VSILSAGTFFGALIGAPLADMIGRRLGLMVACLVFSVGVAMQVGSKEGLWTRKPLILPRAERAS